MYFDFSESLVHVLRQTSSSAHLKISPCRRCLVVNIGFLEDRKHIVFALHLCYFYIIPYGEDPKLDAYDSLYKKRETSQMFIWEDSKKTLCCDWLVALCSYRLSCDHVKVLRTRNSPNLKAAVLAIRTAFMPRM